MHHFELYKRTPKELVPAQVKLFQDAQLLRVTIGFDKFLPEHAKDILHAAEGRQVVALGIGGTNLIRANSVVRHGKIEVLDVITLTQGKDGRGYITKVEELRDELRGQDTPIGIAVAGPVENGKILAASNLPIFFDEVMEKYEGKLALLFPSAAIAMDDVLSTLAASMLALERQTSVGGIVNSTVGSGIGGAIYVQESIVSGKIHALEPGLVEISEELIPIKNYQKACGFDGATFTCIENIASGIAIEDLYYSKTNVRLSGDQLSHLASQGDEFVTELYATSALLVAHSIIIPARDIFGQFKHPDMTWISFEGGVHNVPGYTDLLVRTLEHNLGFKPHIIYPNQVPTNASLIGASIAALQMK